MIKSGDPDAIDIYEEYNKVAMNSFPQLSNEDIDNLNKLGYNKKSFNDKVINFNKIKLDTDIDLTGKIDTSNKKTVQRQYAFLYFEAIKKINLFCRFCDNFSILPLSQKTG